MEKKNRFKSNVMLKNVYKSIIIRRILFIFAKARLFIFYVWSLLIKKNKKIEGKKGYYIKGNYIKEKK